MYLYLLKLVFFFLTTILLYVYCLKYTLGFTQDSDIGTCSIDTYFSPLSLSMQMVAKPSYQMTTTCVASVWMR